MTPCTRNAAAGKVLDRLGWRETDFSIEAQGGNPTCSNVASAFLREIARQGEKLYIIMCEQG